MINVGKNFGSDKLCPLCKLESDSQEHMINCFVMKIKSPEIFHSSQTYQQIFNLTDKNLAGVAELCQNAVRTREILMKEINGKEA